MKRFLALLLVASLGQGALACTPAESARHARTAAHDTARQRLSAAAFIYQFMYSDVKYDVQVGQPTIRGNVATVRGSLTLKGTEKRTGKPAQGSYRGTVTLGKVGACRWKVTGYRQD